MKEKRFILLTCVVAAIIFCVISCGGEGLVDEISDGGEEESPVNEPDTNDNLNTDTNNYLPEPEASLDINEDDSEQKFEEPPAPVRGTAPETAAPRLPSAAGSLSHAQGTGRPREG